MFCKIIASSKHDLFEATNTILRRVLNLCFLGKITFYARLGAYPVEHSCFLSSQLTRFEFFNRYELAYYTGNNDIQPFTSVIYECSS